MQNNQPFSLSDFLYRKAYPKLNTKRGTAELQTKEKLTQGEQEKGEFVSPFSLRALTVGTDSAGGNTKENVVAGEAFQNFYNPSIFMTHGTLLTGLKSDITIDAKNTPAVLTSKAVSETTTAANTFRPEPAFSGIKLSPKFVRVSIELSLTLLEQSSRDVDELILDDMRMALSEELDRQVMKGDSTKNEIKGIVNTTGISKATWGALSALTGSDAHSKLADSEGSLGTAKVPNPYYFLMNSNTRKRLRGVRNTGLNYPILTDSNQLLGYDALITENLSDSDCWAMNPSFCVVVLWHDEGVFDLIVDGYTKSNQGKVVLTMSIMADAALVKPKALSVISEN